MMKQKQSKKTDKNDRVTLNLTVQGERKRIMNLLEQMNLVSGYSVLKGSFTAKTEND